MAAISSARATNEENHLIQKFIWTVIGTNSVDNCSRLCHFPSAAGLTAAFGLSGGTDSFDDVERADCLLMVGANPVEAHSGGLPCGGVHVAGQGGDQVRVCLGQARQLSSGLCQDPLRGPRHRVNVRRGPHLDRPVPRPPEIPARADPRHVGGGRRELSHPEAGDDERTTETSRTQKGASVMVVQSSGSEGRPTSPVTDQGQQWNLPSNE
ncbi:hypothetical protein ACFQBS_31015 [Planomonospora parontospora]|uniref:hypothetical protein n=1 Tax=Planomonospora parontospora TaxID=58119 RepID=UPI00360A2AD5